MVVAPALARMIFKPWQDIGGGNNFDTVKSSLALALKSGVQTPVDRESCRGSLLAGEGPRRPRVGRRRCERRWW